MMYCCRDRPAPRAVGGLCSASGDADKERVAWLRQLQPSDAPARCGLVQMGVKTCPGST